MQLTGVHLLQRVGGGARPHQVQQLVAFPPAEVFQQVGQLRRSQRAQLTAVARQLGAAPPCRILSDQHRWMTQTRGPMHLDLLRQLGRVRYIARGARRVPAFTFGRQLTYRRGGAVESRTFKHGLRTTRRAGRSGSAIRSASRSSAASPIAERGGDTAVSAGLNSWATSSS